MDRFHGKIGESDMPGEELQVLFILQILCISGLGSSACSSIHVLRTVGSWILEVENCKKEPDNGFA